MLALPAEAAVPPPRGGEEPLKVVEKKRRPDLPWWSWAGFAIILVFCMPWYFSFTGVDGIRVWAFPLWGAIIVGFSFLLAVYTAFVYLRVWKAPMVFQPRFRN